MSALSAAVLALAVWGSPAEAQQSTSVPATELDLSSACRATVAVEMGRSPRGITVERHSSGYLALRYVRSEDRQVFRFLCEGRENWATGRLIVWATIRGDGSIGRWRDDWRYDNQITVRRDGSEVVVTRSFPGGIGTPHRFRLADVSANPR